MPRDHDREAFSRVVAGNERRLRAYLVRRLPPDAVDDVLADVLLVAWRRRAEMPAEALPWLLNVAQKTLATRWRGEARRAALVALVAAQPHRVAPSVEADLRRRDQRRALAISLGALTEPDRELLLLRFWDDLRPREIAAVMNLPPVTVRARLRRATVRLHRHLRDALERGAAAPQNGEAAGALPDQLPMPTR